MIRFSKALLLAIPCVAALLAPSPADACSPIPPGLYASIPETGETYPANAVLVLSGEQITLDGVTVTITPPIDPPPVLVPADVPFGLGAIAVRLEPPPPPGHMVDIAGEFCPPEYMCEPQVISYVVGAPDDAAPEAPTGVSFDVYDYPDYVSGGGDCTSDSDLGYWVHLMGKPAVAGESPVVYTIVARKTDTPEAVVSTSFVLKESSATVVFRLLAEQIAGADPAEALCFDVTVSDTALNAAPVTESMCLPCRVRVETSPADPYPQPEEPAWTPQDAYPGGPCKGDGGAGGGTAGSGGEGGEGGGGAASGGNGGDDAVVGCGCEIERPARGNGLLLLGVGLALATAWRRRR